MNSVAMMLVIGAAMAGGGGYTLDWYSMDGGGVEKSGVSGGWEMAGSIAQPDGGRLSGGSYSMTGGFRIEQAAGDCDIDGGVTLFDWASLPACFTGPFPIAPDPRICPCIDADGDDDVDLVDLAAFQVNYSGTP